MHQLTPERCFGQLLSGNPAAPFVTYYDEASGERSELSARSLANWVAKTHFLLIDELGLGVGAAALAAVPAHWISVAPILGCLTAGLEIVDEPGRAEVAFVSPDTAARAVGVPEVYALAPASAAVGFRGDVAGGLTDYVLAVRPQPDKWSTVQFAAGPDDPCLGGWSREETVARASARAADLGIERGGRVLTQRNWTGPNDLIDALFAPLVAGASLVIVRNASEDVLARRAEQEKVTVRI